MLMAWSRGNDEVRKRAASELRELCVVAARGMSAKVSDSAEELLTSLQTFPRSNSSPFGVKYYQP